MIFIFIDSVLLAALIFGGLATGAGVTSVVVAFILKHKTVIVVITVLGVLVSEIVTYGEITDKIKAIIYIIINTVFDLILQTGYIAITLMYLNCISDNFKTGYSQIITSYSVIKEYDNNSSLLEIEIETGKTHQIRAHLAHIGYPIIGDGKYGINSVNKDFGFKFQQLKAYELTFNFLTDAKCLNYLNGKNFSLK